jgi:hypothetical protein
MAVWVIGIGRPARDANPDQGDDIRSAVGERVEAVGQDADRTGEQPEHDLRGCDKQVED